MDNYLDIANSIGMWIACSLMVLVVIFQALLFMRKAYKTGNHLGLTQKQMKSALRTGAITSIGPSFAIVIAMISLIVSVGSPFAWMRLSVIGSVPFELMAAKTGAEALGVELGGQGYGMIGFANSVWTNTLGAAGWLIICALFTDKFEILRKKAVRGNDALLPVLSVSAMIGAFAYFGAPYLAAKGMASTVSYVVGATIMVAINLAAGKLKAGWIKEWSLGIAMICGMSVALFFS